MPRKDPAALQRKREKKERIKREKDNKASAALTEQGRATLDIVLDGGKGSSPSTNLPKSMKDFEDALNLNPENADAFFYRGRCQQELQDLDKAIADYASCLAITNNQHIPALMQQSICFETQGGSDNIERAIQNYTTIIEIDPRHNDAAYNLRGCAKLRGRGGLGLKLRHLDFVAVEADFLSAIRCNENNYYALCNLGRLYDEHEMFDKAVLYYTKSMEVKDDYNYAAYRRGCAALTAVEEALRKAERGIAPDPTVVVLNESCAAVPFQISAPKDASKVQVPKGTPSNGIFGLSTTTSSSNNNNNKKSGGLLPPLNHHSVSRNANTNSNNKAMMLGTPASHHHNPNNNKAAAAANVETEFEKQARQQVEREMAEEKHFATLKQYLNTAIGDFSRVLAPLVENEDKIKELPTLLHRASCYLFEGDLEKAEEDIVFVRRNLEAFKEAQEESPNSTSPTSYVAVKNAYQLIVVRLENAKARRRHALPISPFALGGANSLMAAVQKFEAQQVTMNAALQQMQQQQQQQQMQQQQSVSL